MPLLWSWEKTIATGATKMSLLTELQASGRSASPPVVYRIGNERGPCLWLLDLRFSLPAEV
jgi:hypothetical protein